MTIAVAVRTNSAVIFAADSKVTTVGVVGLNQAGEPQWLPQTYDNFTKVVHDRHKALMAVVAGDARLGNVTATDFIAARGESPAATSHDQEVSITTLANEMATIRADYWHQTKVPVDNWPVTVLMMAMGATLDTPPRVWHITFQEVQPAIREILTTPRLWMEGSYRNAFTLLYGYDSHILESLRQQLGISEADFEDALQKRDALSPIDMLSLGSMPIQDAIDLAVFVATTQVQMDRFLPGEPACGGPIDVMVLRTAPYLEILSFPGKELRHPMTRI